MAKLISPVWSIIRGSIAGTTYLSGPGNTIIARQKTAPVNPGSEYQSLIRGLINEAAALWKEDLLPADRKNWDLYAATFQMQGPLGPYGITGQNAWIQSYVTSRYYELLGANTNISEDVPTVPGRLDVGSYQLVARVNAGTGFQLNAVNNATEDVVIGVVLSGPWFESKNFFKGPWDPQSWQFFDLAASTSASFDVDTAITARYYFAKIKAVSAAGATRTQSSVILRQLATTV